ncbi:MAG: hypothetical protein M5U15_12840 [Kiritimatiellae bacterium]|nr:hypothetical protein [Kiritimatiellia bacterium]
MKLIPATLASLALLLAAALPTFAQVPGSARVLEIQTTTGVTRAESGLRTLGGARMTKFLEDGVEVPAAVLAVAWSQQPGLAPGNLSLRLDYKMDDRPEIQTLSRTLAPTARGRQVSRFEIPLSVRSGYRVSAWRLQLRAGERVIEEYKSAAWGTQK